METEHKPIVEMRCHRILVRVTDDEIADEMLGGVMSTMLKPTKTGSKSNIATGRVPSKNVNADIDVLNCTTLSLTRKNLLNPEARSHQIMYFDCVGRTDSDPKVRNELSNLFDMLLVDRRNCCLVHMKPIRDRPTKILNSVLVPEVDKRLAMLQGTLSLHSIKLEYYDVQKYDVVNMFQKSKNKSQKSTNEVVFRNTRELLRWTQRSYPFLWSNGSEHDCFDLEFAFVEAPGDIDSISCGGGKVNVKLSIMQFYLNKMDGDMRVGIRNFLENVNRPNLRMKHSILTDYLREYFFNEQDLWHIWMLFDVPMVNYGSSLANDMLALATAAYTGIHDNSMLVNNSDFDLLFNSSIRKPNNVSRQYAGSIHSAANTPARSKPQNNSMNCSQTGDAKMGNYSLSFWYCRIDESYVNVITTMERYYDRKYDLKVQRMCGDLKRISRSIERETSRQNLDIFDDNDINNDELVQTYLRQYREALSAFRLLVQKIGHSKYAEQLNVFVKTKNNDIAKQTRQMKVRLLELCQARLSSTIKDEVKTLNSDRDLNARISDTLTKTMRST